MADSLVLKGVKHVKKQTGSEMLLKRPTRGGDTFNVKRWWPSSGTTLYAKCTIFEVTSGANKVNLVLDTNSGTDIRIDHDGSFNFTFIGNNEIDRAALFTTDMQLIEHYVFSKISGGKTMTVVPAGAASRPS